MRGIGGEGTGMLPNCRYQFMCLKIGDVKIDRVLCDAVHICNWKKNLLQRDGGV